jgi:hypothetical protein
MSRGPHGSGYSAKDKNKMKKILIVLNIVPGFLAWRKTGEKGERCFCMIPSGPGN